MRTALVAGLVLLGFCAATANTAPPSEARTKLQGAALEGRLEVVEHEPIVIAANIEVPEGWSAMFDWDLQRPAKGRETDNGRTLHVWAPPGEYEIELEVFLAKYDEATKQVQFRKDTSVTALVVKPSNAPRPPDPPDPTPGRPSAVLILRDQESDTATEAAALQDLRQSELFQGGTPKLLILSTDAETPDGKPDPISQKYLAQVPQGSDYPYFFAVDASDHVVDSGEVPDDPAELIKRIQARLR